MGRSLPGIYLRYLSKDDLAPEEYERILSPSCAWRRICEQYEFDDRYNAGFYIINRRESPALRSPHQSKPHGPREKARLERMIFGGEVVMLSDMHGPADLFYINEKGALIIHSPRAFSLQRCRQDYPRI